MQPILLLSMEGVDRREIVARWLRKAEIMVKMYEQGEYKLLYGGHGQVDTDILPDLIKCGRGILDGSILKKRVKIHIFDADFSCYGKVYIFTDTMDKIKNLNF